MAKSKYGMGKGRSAERTVEMRKFFSLFLALAAFGAGGATAEATLIDRGNGLIYDTELNVTWLQDANYAMTSGYDADGRMQWTDAVAWAENLIYGGYDDWRLPTALNMDGSGPCFGYDCTGSEMGHLFYLDLGGTASSTISTSGPFLNIMPYHYWSSTNYNVNAAWDFHFDNDSDGGLQHYPAKYYYYYAWAVRSGDVATSIPEPGTMLLMGAGLAGAVAFRRFFRR